MSKVLTFEKGWHSRSREPIKESQVKTTALQPVDLSEFPKVMSIDFISSEFGFSPDTVRNWIQNKELEAQWIGNRYRIFRKSLALFLAKKNVMKGVG